MDLVKIRGIGVGRVDAVGGIGGGCKGLARLL